MVVKSELKLIKSLQQKKCRNEQGLFVVEGQKALKEVLNSNFKRYKMYSSISENIGVEGVKAIKVSTNELKQMSSLKNPNGYLGVFYIPQPMVITDKDWVLALDSIQDPGNLGTIIRLCDWFGIKHIVCSNDTVDCYNPKVLQATMGSITRVYINYTNMVSFLKKTDLPVYGTFIDGKNVIKCQLPKKGVLVMGNEGKGISKAISKLCEERLTILQFGKKTTESLNVATATAILLQEIRR